MRIHEIFLQDPFVPTDDRPLPTYDTDPGRPKYVLSGDGRSVFQIVAPAQVVVPLMPAAGRDLQDLAMALVEASLTEAEAPPLEAGSVWGAVLEGARRLDDLDLRLGTVLVRTGTEVPAFAGARTASHRDVEPGLVVCLPDPQFLGMMPTVDGEAFGMILHNADAVVPVRVVPD